MDKHKCDLIQFFPVNVWKVKIKKTKEEKTLLIKKIKEIQKNFSSEHKSNIGGYHSPLFPYYEFVGGEFEFIYKHIVSLINEVIIPREKSKFLKENNNSKEFCTAIEENISVMWFIINKKGDYNNKHLHPPAWYSGVYYVKKPKNSGNLRFHDPIPERYFENTSHTLSEVKVDEGELILFPGWFQHSVGKNESNKERISISFNITRPDYIKRI